MRPEDGSWSHGEVAPPDIHLPRPTIWPMVLAGGVALILGGIILNLLFTLAGLVVLAIALVGWVQELRRA